MTQNVRGKIVAAPIREHYIRSSGLDLSCREGVLPTRPDRHRNPVQQGVAKWGAILGRMSSIGTPGVGADSTDQFLARTLYGRRNAPIEVNRERSGASNEE